MECCIDCSNECSIVCSMQIDVGHVCCICSASVHNNASNVCHKCKRLVCSTHRDWVLVCCNADNYYGIEGVDHSCCDSFASIRACQDCQREEWIRNMLLWAFFATMIGFGIVMGIKCAGGCGSDSTDTIVLTQAPNYYGSDYYG